MQSITTDLPIGFSLICILIAALYAYFLYQKHPFNKKSWMPLFMASLRFFTVFLLTFFLLNPFVSSLLIEKERPIIVIAIDQSESMQHTSAVQELPSHINNLQENLAKNYQLELYSFGNEVNPLDSFRFDQKKTDYSAFFQYLEDLYKNRNVAAVVFASDGLYNMGKNPIYMNYPFQAPLYAIALGDTTPRKDLLISNLTHNDLAFLGNTFPIEISGQSQFCKGEKIQLTVTKEQEQLHNEEIILTKSFQRFRTKLFLPADDLGTQSYTVSLSKMEGELNTENNSQNFFIDVLESKQKILLLTSKSHPDIFAITTAIEQNENFEVHQKFMDDFDGNYEPYNLLIAFHVSLDVAPLPTWHVLGAQTNSRQFDWLEMNSLNSIGSEVLVNLKPFSFFQIDEEWVKWIQKLPPLSVPFSRFDYQSDYQNLFAQTEKGIVTNKPIFSFHQGQDNRQAIWVGEGLWKWRLFEYAEKESHHLFDDLVQQCVQFLAVKEDKSFFRLKIPKKIYENESLSISAQLYDANYELYNAPEVRLVLKNSQGAEYVYIFDKNSNKYALELTNLTSGSYQYEATVMAAGNEYVRNGNVTIMPLQVEQRQKQANHQILNKLATNKGGKLFYVSEIPELQERILAQDSKTISYSRLQLSELLNHRWIFFLLLVFLSLEWFLRKQNGSI